MEILHMVAQQKPANLGDYIYNRRRILDMSRADLALRMTAFGYSCTESAINHWENGRANPPIEEPAFVRVLAGALETTTSEIIRASGMFDNITPELAQSVLSRLSPEVVQLLNQASPKNIKKIDALIRALLTEDE